MKTPFQICDGVMILIDPAKCDEVDKLIEEVHSFLIKNAGEISHSLLKDRILDTVRNIADDSCDTKGTLLEELLWMIEEL